ncbi:hypothetical protein C0991_010264 [Blastosporella zonata]|nr:hypothetical protein C0991_010264 [Blastosporella zonata]
MDKIILGSQLRLAQVTEIYSDLYYQSKIAPIVKEETPPGANHKEQLNIVKCITQTLWEAEENDVMEIVHARLAELKAKKEAKKVEPPEMPTPEEITANLDDMPAFMGWFLDYLHASTGWSFSCVMGGPDLSIDNEMQTCSFHIGQTLGGKDFSQFYDKFQTTVLKPYTHFLHAVYPEVLCDPNEVEDDLLSAQVPSSVNDTINEKKKQTSKKKSKTTVTTKEEIGGVKGESSKSGSASPPISVPAPAIAKEVKQNHALSINGGASSTGNEVLPFDSE